MTERFNCKTCGKELCHERDSVDMPEEYEVEEATGDKYCLPCFLQLK